MTLKLLISVILKPFILGGENSGNSRKEGGGGGGAFFKDRTFFQKNPGVHILHYTVYIYFTGTFNLLVLCLLVNFMNLREQSHYKM